MTKLCFKLPELSNSGNLESFSRLFAKSSGNLTAKFSGVAITLTALAGVFVAIPSKAATLVDLELALLVDVSGSVDTTEFNLQRAGYVNAFNNPAVWNVIDGLKNNGGTGKIAATFVYWSTTGTQQQAVNWTLIDSFAASQGFASAIGAAARPFTGGTNPGSAINFIVPRFGTETGGTENGFTSLRQVIDVSGDGSGPSTTATARDNALASGIDAINGLAILGSESGLEAWYNNNIKGGSNSFVKVANTFGDFTTAVEDKITLEIQQGQPPTTAVPEPFTVVGTLVGGAAAFRLRKRFKATNKL
ncbi:DUF1194 domain-containing protein [Chamaesiphon sp.]|uniref:DUF1194 domain-containing protein n=1 Tax=Chamaesiphon sp. TaxID=2814140 RepID=UPI003593B125